MARRQVGERVGASTSKKCVTEIQSSNIQRQSRQVYSIPMIQIAKGDGINQRSRQTVNLRGFKIEMHAVNLQPRVFILNWAILHPRAAAMGTVNAAGTLPPSEMFRSHSQRRSMAMTTSESGLEWTNASINTDLFAVLKRGRITFNPGRDATDPQDGDVVYHEINKGSTYRSKGMWIPIKRQVRFDASLDSQHPMEQIWFTYWIDEPMANGGSLSIQAAVAMQYRFICYFRDPKN